MVVRQAFITCLLLVLAVPSSVLGGDVPSKEELKKKKTKELKQILRSKGLTCKTCVEKDHYIDEVIKTWHLTPKEASSPDGKIHLSKETFISQLTSTFKEQMQRENGGDGKGGGHQLEGQDMSDQFPDLENIWADFAAKLQSGEVSEKDGKLNYEVPPVGGYGQGSLWRRFKDYGMIILNFTLMFVLYKVRKRERKNKREELAATEAAEKESIEPGSGTKED